MTTKTGIPSQVSSQPESFPPYVPGTAYAAGDKVLHNGVVYEVLGWPYAQSAGGPAKFYEPGEGLGWQDAWRQVG